MKKSVFLLFLTCCSLFSISAVYGQTVRSKKAIAHGWDLLWRTTASLRENLDRLDALPYDGISMTPRMNHPTKGECDVHRFNDGYLLQRSWFKDYMEVGRELCKRKGHNFLTVFWMPQWYMSWTDDKAWETAAANLGTLAWMAHEMGCRGIILDSEDYKHVKQYYLRGSQTFEEMAPVVRKRGRQLMESMIREFPDITILSFYLLSLDPLLWNPSFPPREVARQTGSLWPIFINGMLDVLPPSATMVDGCEHGYGAEYDANGFYRLADDIRHQALGLVEPENRDKYRRQVQVGFGLYLDTYVKGYAPIPKPPVDGSVAKRLFNNIHQAMQVADEYCWFYGEHNHFINWDGKDKVSTWEQELPGLHEAIRLVKNPTVMAGKWLDDHRAKGTLPPSQVANPQCRVMDSGHGKQDRQQDWSSGNLPVGWSFWQEWKTGTFGLADMVGRGDSSSLTAKAIGNGCFITSFAVKPGDCYVLEGFCKGGNRPRFVVRWRDAADWTAYYHHMPILSLAKEADEGGWKRIVGMIVVPKRATQLVLLLSDYLPEKTEARVWFDAVNAYRLPMTEGKIPKAGK